MYVKERIKEFFRRLFIPGFWVQTHPTDYEYSELLDKALDKYGIVPINEYRSKVGGLYVWTSGYPYAYGQPFTTGNPREFLRIIPTTKVRKKMKKMLTRKTTEFNL